MSTKIFFLSTKIFVLADVRKIRLFNIRKKIIFLVLEFYIYFIIGHWVLN